MSNDERPPAPPIPNSGDELTLLTAFLDFYRAALADRAYGLSHDQLQRALAPSTLTLSRLIGHMASVERTWFHYRFAGLEIIEPWASLNFEADYDAEMTHAQTLSGEELLALYASSCDDSRAHTADAASLDQLSVRTRTPEEEPWSLRWILIHMIEEYARHCGHADFIRESIDGDVCS